MKVCRPNRARQIDKKRRTNEQARSRGKKKKKKTWQQRVAGIPCEDNIDRIAKATGNAAMAISQLHTCAPHGTLARDIIMPASPLFVSSFFFSFRPFHACRP